VWPKETVPPLELDEELDELLLEEELEELELLEDPVPGTVTTKSRVLVQPAVVV
jgi:hypothetical protein